MKTKKELIDQYFREKSQTDITQSEFAQKHNINPYTLLYWLQKDPRYQRTNVVYNQEERKNKVDEFFKLNQETDISQREFTKMHKIARKTLYRWLRKDPRYQRANVVPYKQPTLDTSGKQHLDESKEKNSETVYDSSTLIDKYPELEKLLDHINDAFPYNSEVLPLEDQPSTSRMTPDLSWYSSQENLSMIQESLPLEDQPSTSRMTLDISWYSSQENLSMIQESLPLEDQPSTSRMTPDLSWYSSQENLSMIQESLPLEDQPSTSRMTPDISWYSSQENLSMIQESLPLEDQPSTSRMTPDISWYSSHENLSMIQESLALEHQPSTSNQTNLENKIKNAKITANQSNRTHPYNKTNLDRAFR